MPTRESTWSFTMVDDESQYFQNCWQFRTTCSYFFYLSIDWNINRLEYSDRFFVLFTVLICSYLIFNLLKRVFSFLTFLNLGAQIRCTQNWYTNLKSTLDQPLMIMLVKPFYFFENQCMQILIFLSPNKKILNKKTF